MERGSQSFVAVAGQANNVRQINHHHRLRSVKADAPPTALRAVPPPRFRGAGGLRLRVGQLRRGGRRLSAAGFAGAGSERRRDRVLDALEPDELQLLRAISGMSS